MISELEQSFRRRAAAIIRFFIFVAIVIPYACRHARAIDPDEVDIWKEDVEGVEELAAEFLRVYPRGMEHVFAVISGKDLVEDNERGYVH